MYKLAVIWLVTQAHLLFSVSSNIALYKVYFNCSDITSKLGYRNVSDLTPTEIAIEAFEQVQSFLDKEDGMTRPGGL